MTILHGNNIKSGQQFYRNLDVVEGVVLQYSVGNLHI